jgi:Na+/H+-translocating membrane pyrophosphatase
VGDNVGDVAGMGADLFGSFAESTCAALVVSAVSDLGITHNWVAMSFPLLISASGILVCLVTTLIATDLSPARQISEIQSTLKNQLIISTVIMTPVGGVCVCGGGGGSCRGCGLEGGVPSWVVRFGRRAAWLFSRGVLPSCLSA